MRQGSASPSHAPGSPSAHPRGIQPLTSGQGEGESPPLEGVGLVEVALLDGVGGAGAALDDLPAVDAELDAGTGALQQRVLHGEPQGELASLVKLGTDQLKLKIQGLLLSLQLGTLQGGGDARLPGHGDRARVWR